MCSWRRNRGNRGICSVMFVFYGTFVLVRTPDIDDIHVCLRFHGDKNDGNGLRNGTTRSRTRHQCEHKCTIQRSGSDFVGACASDRVLHVFPPGLTTRKSRRRRGHSSCIRHELPCPDVSVSSSRSGSSSRLWCRSPRRCRRSTSTIFSGRPRPTQLRGRPSHRRHPRSGRPRPSAVSRPW
jgi:hypothetical protein